MPMRLPKSQWPFELEEEGPPEDRSVLLGGVAVIGKAPHRVIAVRLDPSTLGVDYRADVAEDVYADLELETMLDELTFLDDIDHSVLVPIGGGHYVLWMMPSSGSGPA